MHDYTKVALKAEQFWEEIKNAKSQDILTIAIILTARGIDKGWKQEGRDPERIAEWCRQGLALHLMDPYAKPEEENEPQPESTSPGSPNSPWAGAGNAFDKEPN